MSSPAIQPRPRVKRKPAPSIDARYPSPDPDDPFAPLWVLRSRSSNGALALAPSADTLRGRKPSYNLYPAFHDAPVLLQDSHYRRRSQSTPPTHAAPGQVVVAFPAIQSNPYIYANTDHAVPSLLTDHTGDSSGTDVDPVPAAVSAKPVPPSWPSTPIRFARLLLPKRNRTSLPSKPPIRVLAVGISSPLHIEHAPRARKVTTSISSSSFVHISTPSISTTYSSTPDDAHAYTSPRPAPAPALVPVAVPVTPNPIPTSTSAPLPSARPRPHARHARHPLSLSFHSSHPCHSPPPAHHAEPEWSLPTPVQLARAAALPIVAASGLRVPFGTLFAARRTVVLFVRHFWCPLCQDYITSVVETAHPDVMSHGETGAIEPVELVVISNGAPAFIPKYRQLFSLPFELYTDPTLAVYTALGMGRAVAHSAAAQVQCASAGPGTGPRACTPGPGVRDGGYVRHGVMAGLAMVVVRALKAGMPVWEKGGDIHQLGGEFVLGPGLRCTYAHRMQSTKGHAPIRDVLAAAGVRLPTPSPARPPAPPVPVPVPVPALTTPPTAPRLHRRNSTNNTVTHTDEFGAWRRRSMAVARTEGAPRASLAVLSPEEEAAWMQERMQSLERLRERKSERRGAFVGYHGSGSGAGVESGAGAAAGSCSGKEKETETGRGEEEGARSEGGHCSLAGEENVEQGVNARSAVDLAEVMVIGFAGRQAGETVEGEDDDDNDMGVSPTDATEDSGEREAA